MKKIFCEDCRNYYHGSWAGSRFPPPPGTFFTLCKARAREAHNAVCSWKVYANCEEVNQNNDCAQYRPKTWKRLKDFLKGILKIKKAEPEKDARGVMPYGPF
jgi:hypothetical protein